METNKTNTHYSEKPFPEKIRHEFNLKNRQSDDEIFSFIEPFIEKKFKSNRSLFRTTRTRTKNNTYSSKQYTTPLKICHFKNISRGCR